MSNQIRSARPNAGAKQNIKASSSNGEFWKRTLWVVPTVGLALIWVMSRVGSVLPKIMGDELIYSTNARHLPLAESTVPNYLFNILFSSTNLCGTGFYSCAKVINMFLLVGLAAVIYLTARLFAKPGISFAFALLILLGPISSYVSYFTPDLMFYFASSAIIYWLLRLTSETKQWVWALVGAGVGLVTLVKPHGLFLLAPAVIYIVYLAFKTPAATAAAKFAKAGINTVLFGGVAFAVKLGLGFVFAGNRGLVLFGGSYDQAANTSLSSAPAPSGADLVATTVANTSVKPLAESVVPPVGISFADGSWVGPMALQLLWHTAFLLIFFGVPLILLVRQAIVAIRAKSEAVIENRLAILVLLTAITLVATTAAFSIAATNWGEQLDKHLIVRYYEYVLPFVPLILLVPGVVGKTFSKRAQLWISLVVIAIMAASLPGMMTYVPDLFAQSALIASVLQSGLTLYPFAILGLATLVYLFRNPENTTKMWLFVFTPIIILVYAISSYVNMTVPSSIVGLYTSAGRYAHENLTAEQLAQTTVVGNVLNNVQQTQLWADNPAITGRAVSEGAELNLADIPADKQFIIAVGSMTINGDIEVLHQVEGWALLKRK